MRKDRQTDESVSDYARGRGSIKLYRQAIERAQQLADKPATGGHRHGLIALTDRQTDRHAKVERTLARILA